MKQFRKILFNSVLVFLVSCFVLTACSKDEADSNLSGNDILTFSIFGYQGTTSIDPTAHTVKITLPAKVRTGRDLLPEFTLSEGAKAYVVNEEQISGESPVTFNSVISYRIVAGNNEEAVWKVTVTNNDYSLKWGLGLFVTESRSNESSSPGGFYLEQQHTGYASDYNCGPTSATMAALWAKPGFTKTVADARDAIPVSRYNPSDTKGWWYPQDVLYYLQDNRINAEIVELPGKTLCTQGEYENTLQAYLNNDNIIVVCLKMGFFTYNPNQNSEYKVDAFYQQGSNGHFIVAKGYKKVDNVLYFEVHDPWGLDLKYADGTFKGANRYYRSNELWKATKDHNYRLVVISK